MWNAEFVFEGSREWLLGQSLKFDVRDYDGVLFKSEPLGVAQVDLSNLELSHVPKVRQGGVKRAGKRAGRRGGLGERRVESRGVYRAGLWQGRSAGGGVEGWQG